MLIMAFAVIIFGDFLGYGSAKKNDDTSNELDSEKPHDRLGITGVGGSSVPRSIDDEGGPF